MKVLSDFKNGNQRVRIYANGTKIRYVNDNEDIPKSYNPIYPENIDINLSYSCETMCKYCYIDASPFGKSVNQQSLNLLNDLTLDFPKIEVAVNLNTSHNARIALMNFVNKFKDKFIINVTTKYNMKNIYLLKNLQNLNYIYGIGISIDENIIYIENSLFKGLKNINIHIINGVHNIDALLKTSQNRTFLILGYKEIGRGKSFFNKNTIKDWSKIFKLADKNNHTLIFDTLCLTQIKKTGYKFDQQIINERYLGEDGSTSMYIDLVTNTVHKNSIIAQQKSTKPLYLNRPLRELFQITRKQ